jgi:hypothetical protein
MKKVIPSILILIILATFLFFLLQKNYLNNKSENKEVGLSKFDTIQGNTDPIYLKNKSVAMNEIANHDERLSQDGENMKITKEYIPNDCPECLSVTYEYDHYGMEDTHYKVHLLIKNGKVLDVEDQGRTKQENPNPDISYWKECIRDIPERVLNQQKLNNYEFALNNEDGRGVEIASLSDGIKLTVKNEGCISYSLVFEFTFPSDKQHKYEDEKYWQKRTIGEMTKIIGVVNSPLNIQKSVEMLQNRFKNNEKILYESILYLDCLNVECDNKESITEQILKETVYLKRLGYDLSDESVIEAIYFGVGEL